MTKSPLSLVLVAGVQSTPFFKTPEEQEAARVRLAKRVAKVLSVPPYHRGVRRDFSL